MVDLKAQYEKIGHEIDNAIKSVLVSTAFIKGPDVKLFEEELQELPGRKTCCFLRKRYRCSLPGYDGSGSETRR